MHQVMVTKPRTFAIAGTAAILVTLGGYAAFFDPHAPQAQPVGASPRPIWTKVSWPFPLDLWGPGQAFRCKAADCGSEVYLYLRAKIGFCNCTSAVDDEMVDRVGDVDLLAGERSALGPGRVIDVHSMKGRSRTYAVGGRHATAKSALSIAFHNRCDLIVATAAIGDGQPGVYEDPVLEFLNSEVVLRWAEVTLGL
jgi:hypothetical protein